MDAFLNPEEIMELSKRNKPKYGLDKDIEDTQKEMEEVASAQKENPEFVRGYDQRLIDLSKKLEELNSAKRSVASTDEMKPETKSPIVNAMGQDNSSTMEKYGMDVTSEFPNYKAFEEQPMAPQMGRMSPSDKREVESLFGANKTEMPEGLLPFAQSAQPSMPLKSEGKAMPQMAGGVRAPVSSDQKQMQDFIDAEKAQGSDYVNRLKEAEQRSRDIELASMLGKAFSQIGGGIAQTKAKADLGKMDTSVYDQLGKTSQRPLEELKRSVEMEKDDPNSDASKSLRSMAKADLEKAGVKLDLGSMSYNQLTSVFPHLSRMAERIESAKLRQQQAAETKRDREELKYAKMGSELNNKITEEIASSRSVFGKAANIKRSAEAIEQLMGQMPDPNNLDSRQIKEIARSLDSMLSMGAATVSGTKGLVPSSLAGDFNSIVEYISNIPRGQKQGQFVKRMMETVQREKELAKKQIDNTKTKIIGGYSPLRQKAPEMYKEILERHGLTDTYQEDKEAEEFIKNNINSTDPVKKSQALKILQLRKQSNGI
jgi:hypothetical protein